MLPSLFAAEPVLHRGWPACWPAGYRHCSCLCSGRPGSWFSSRTSSPFLSRSRRLSSATRSGSSAAAVDPRCRPFPPACRSLTYHSSSMCYEAGRASVYKVLFFFSVQRRHKHCYHTAVSHTEQTEQQPCFSHPRVANDATFSYPEWSRWNSGMIVKIKSHQLKKSVMNVGREKNKNNRNNNC